MKYLANRNGALYFRRRVPDSLKDVIGQSEWYISLKLELGNESQAAGKILQLTRQTDKQIAQARKLKDSNTPSAELAEAAEVWARENEFLVGQKGLWTDEASQMSEYDHWLEPLIDRTLRSSGKQHQDELEETDFAPGDWMRIQTVRSGKRVPVAVTIQDALENFDKRHKHGKTARPEITAVDQFVEYAGNLKLVNIRKAKVTDWANWLHQDKGQSASTIQRRINSIKSIAKIAISDFELNIPNPFASVSPPEASRKTSTASEDRLPFHESHLELILRYLEEPRINADWRDLLLVMLNTGARPSEAAGLLSDDVVLNADIPFVWIRASEHRRLKTRNALRKIPLVGDALRVLSDRKQLHQGRLFPEVKLTDANGRPDSRYLSSGLKGVLRKAGVPKSTRLVPYSMRHTLEEALRVSGAPEHIQKAILGHSKGDVTSSYGAATPMMESLKDAIKQALPVLGKVDPYNYTEEELSNMKNP